jgi:hypothetical protein
MRLTNRLSPPLVLLVVINCCICSSRTYDGVWKTRTDVVPELLRAANASTLGWCGNCTTEQRALSNVYVYNNINSQGGPEIDLFHLSTTTHLLNGLNILLVGDSVMREVFYSMLWIFPGTTKRLSRAKELHEHCNDVDFALHVTKLNVTVNYCPNTYLGQHMFGILSRLFINTEFEFVILNSGLWYNQMQIDAEEVEKRRKRNNTALGFMPLTRDQYNLDLIQPFNDNVASVVSPAFQVRNISRKCY